jgi:N6-adenosine-specific RNA methylase IME4
VYLDFKLSDGVLMKKYDIILADCPWSYRDKNKNGERGVYFKYPTLKIKDIQSLPVYKIAKEQSVLFLWVTAPLMQEGLDTVKSWGFKFKTFGFTWIKTNQKTYLDEDMDNDYKFKGIPKDKNQVIKRWNYKTQKFVYKSIHIGLGNYTRANPEFCLIGTRGKLFEREDKSISSVVIHDRFMKHSEKPKEVIKRIDLLYGSELSKIELFARKRYDGWDATGLDLGGEGKGEDIRGFLNRYE